MPRALLSVSDKTGIVDLGRGLVSRGFELVSTGGTARALADAGLPVTNVSDVTGFPEMMDGRVKTLHPAVHAGILARRDHPADLAAVDQHRIGLVDVVAVNLYPFARAAANPATPFDALVEEIDIGGPSLVRAAAKNFRHVLVVVSPHDYARLLDAIDSGPTLAFRFELMLKAFAHTAEYDGTIAATLLEVNIEGDQAQRGGPPSYQPTIELADRFDLSLEKIGNLRYGENPHQTAAWYRPAAGLRGIGLGGASILQGKELSYTNLLDLDAAARVVLEFSEPAAVVVKHTNPCGAATGSSAADAYVRARDADSVAAFGGIVALNRPIDVAAAEAIGSTFIEAVVAPSVDEPALTILAKKTNMRVLTMSFDVPRVGDYELRSILGATLSQERDRVSEARDPWSALTLSDAVRVVTTRQPTDAEWEALSDEPGRRRQRRGDESATGSAPAHRIGRGVGCLFPIPRRTRCCGRCGCDGRRPARRIEARRGSDRGRGRTRPCHGVYGPEALPALTPREAW